MICTSSCNPFPVGDWENGGQILYIHAMKPSLVILKQQYETGAWDSETLYRTIAWDLEADKAYTAPIDTFNTFEWCPIHVPIRNWDFRGYGLYPLENESLQAQQKLKAPHRDLVDIDSLLFPKDTYPEVKHGKLLFSRQIVSDKFDAYIFYSGGGLVLQTFIPGDKSTRNIELARTKLGTNYYYHKGTRFTSANTFEIRKHYRRFAVTERGNVIPGSICEYHFTTYYVINSEGVIERTDDELFGEIELIRNQ